MARLPKKNKAHQVGLTDKLSMSFWIWLHTLMNLSMLMWWWQLDRTNKLGAKDLRSKISKGLMRWAGELPKKLRLRYWGPLSSSQWAYEIKLKQQTPMMQGRFVFKQLNRSLYNKQISKEKKLIKIYWTRQAAKY